jgi:pyruvate dehydrogenase E1 component alpha subunit
MVGDTIAPWGASYGIPSRTVDGNDVEAVHRAALEAAEYVRENRKPFLLEAWTYRQRGHMEPHDQSYVDPAELESWKAKDPIDRQVARLLASGALTEADVEALRGSARAALETAAAFAAASPFPDVAEVGEGAYA